MAQKNTIPGGLQIEQDLAFLHLFWKIERAGWVVMFVIVLAALAGIVGVGPLSHTATSAGAMTVGYDKFARDQSPTVFTVHLDKLQGKSIELVINEDFLTAYQVKNVMPMPTSVTMTGTTYIYEFAGQSSSSLSQITFLVQPHRIGLVKGSILQGKNQVTVQQFVYP